jgi:thiol:disulfide interchange protein
MKTGNRFVIIATLLGAMYTSAQAQNTDVVSVKLSPSNVKITAGSQVRATLIATIKSPWHINSNKPNEDFLIPSVVTAKAKGIKLAKVKYPEAHEINLSFAEQPVSVYEKDASFELTFTVGKNVAAGKQTVQVTLDYQACDDKTCMPPTSVSATLVVDVAPALPEKKSGESSLTPKTDSTDVAAFPSDFPKQKDVTTRHRAPVVAQTAEGSPSVVLALVFAFIGGIILNLMPCVLPVLSLKIMGIVHQAGESSQEKLKHGVLFTFGVLISFWILAGLLLALRAGGEQLGWGFQLQSPAFVTVLSIFLFLFGLSMFGVFEIGTSLMSVGQGAANKSAYTGSFTSGILATVVATPCTAPFMGSALGFALSQPATVSLLVFTFLGLGMAAPYLFLTMSPKLLQFIPKPGAWMESMKQFMGFLLMATVLWLLWVLSLQTGSEGVLILLAALLLVGLGGWVFGRWGNIAKSQPTRGIAQTVALVSIVGAMFFSLTNITAQTSEATGNHKQGRIEWQKFSPELVDRLRAEGKPVFIDFTAAWCLSCQMNEKVAFGVEEVQNAFIEKGIAAIKADWTNKDSVIAQSLASFGRNSVPLYVLYAPNREAVLLPELLTPNLVLDALNGMERDPVALPGYEGKQ